MAIKRMAVVALAVCSALAGPGLMQAQMGGMGGGQGGGMGGRGGGMGGMGGGPTVAPGTILDPAKSFDAQLTQIENTFINAAKAMPAEKYSFAPSQSIFAPGQAVKYDGVRTFAQLVTHTIQANYRFFGAIGGIKPDPSVDMAAIGNLKSKDEILKALADTFAFAHKAVANVTAANAFESVRGMQSRASTFAAAMGHAEDEYGQVVEYLRMNAIIPPASQMKEM
jgi:hypothetical protein